MRKTAPGVIATRSSKAEGETMIKPKRVNSPIYTFFPTEVEGFDSLAELALVGEKKW